MKLRAVAMVLTAAAFAGVGISDMGEPTVQSDMGEPTVRQVAAAGERSAAADLGHPEGATVIRFEDVTAASGLDTLLDCMMGHAAAIGDADADGLPDLFFGTFTNRPPERYLCEDGARPDQLLRNAGDEPGRASPRRRSNSTRSSGAVFADLDNDGDLDPWS